MRFLKRVTALVLAISVVSPPAFAEGDADKSTARDLATEGQAAFEKKDFKTAEDRFRRADALFHAPTIALGLARSEAGLGKFVAAQESYNKVIQYGAPAGSPPAFGKAVADAQNEFNSVAAKVGSIVITVSGTDNPTVMVDDVAFPVAALGTKRAIDPGSHTIKASASGFKPVEAKAVVPEGGAARDVLLTLEKDPNAVAVVDPRTDQPKNTGSQGGAPPPAERSSGGSLNKTLGYAALGLGGVGVVVGSIGGVLALGKHATLETSCKSATGCKPSDIDSYHSVGTISTVGFIVGGVGLAAGAVLLLTAPKSTESKTGKFITPYVGPGSSGVNVGAVGRF
jgi:hypothetical protein